MIFISIIPSLIELKKGNSILSNKEPFVKYHFLKYSIANNAMITSQIKF